MNQPLALRIVLQPPPAHGIFPDFQRDQLIPFRLRLVRQTARKLLQRIAQLTPVDTGRAQSSWLLAAQQLQPETAANTSTPDLQITEGSIGSLSTITIVNQVPYMPFLELGTSQMSPFAMIRRALLEQIR